MQTKILKKWLLFPLIFQLLYFIKDIGNLVPHWKELDNLPKELRKNLFFRLQAAIVTNALPTYVVVSYY